LTLQVFKKIKLKKKGQDEFKPLMNTWIRDSDCFLFCYDTTNYSSLMDLKEIISKAQSHYENDVGSLKRNFF
jgi:GTPase SAR1 family protein